MTVLTESPRQGAPTAAGGAAPGPTLGRLVRGELLKVRTTNLWWILSICAFVAIALFLLINIALANFQIDEARNPPDFELWFDPNSPPSEQQLAEVEADWRADHQIAEILSRNAANIFTSGQYFGLMIVMLFGAMLVTNEYFHQTATTTFLVSPRRTRVVLSKVAAAVIVAATAWFVTTVIDVGVGSAFFALKGETASLDVWGVQRAILMNLPAYALWALLGMGLGALLRNQIAATLVGAGMYLIGLYVVQIAFLIVYQIWIQQTWVIDVMVAVPSVASSVMISPERAQVTATDAGVPVYLPEWWVGALVLLAYGVLATMLGSFLIRRRDVG